MAQVTSVRDNSRNSINTAISHRQYVLTLTNGIANNGDNIEVHGFLPGLKSRLQRVKVRVSGTLGASATLTAQVNNAGTRTAVTGATTAGAAGNVDSDANANVPYDISGGEVLELLVGGANITAGATVTVDVYASARP